MKGTTTFFRIYYPEPGVVKQKIEAEAGFNISRAIYKELIRATHHHLEKLTDVSDIVMFYESCDRLEEIKSLLGNMDFDYQPMPKGSESEIISQCFEYSFSKGNEKVIYSHVDSPTLTFELIESASYALDKFDAVIGPAQNGEIYLIGMNSTVKETVLTEAKNHDDITAETSKVIVEKVGVNTKTFNKEVCIDTLEDWDNYQATLA